MRRGGQEARVLAALLICLAVTISLAGSPQRAPRPFPAGGDDIPFPTRDTPTWDAKSSSVRPRVPAAIVPEGVAALLLTVMWTACRALLAGRRRPHSLRRLAATSSRRRSFG